MRNLTIFAAGLVFGLGLVLSGMTSPARVMGFLDVTGAWDPSLAFVMGGAVLTATPIFFMARQRRRPVLGEAFDTPATNRIDGRLLGGAALFGIGWGLTGICPGPALVDLAVAPLAIAGFVAAMVAGILFSARVLRPFLDATSPPSPRSASPRSTPEWDEEYSAIPAE
ncbi:YeeE/YedE family protein [Novosphingobium sp. ZN18A2]|uniref:YeeE/YedE family protein n=1 Tax=Novosphingobium sp. ZN18A2 TaxID=3079861 RepID=UPI0030CDDD71